MPKNNVVKDVVKKIIKDYILNNHIIICNTEIPVDKSGNVVDTYYFRVFSMKVLGRTCRNCKFIKSVEWIKDKMHELIALAKKD